MKSDNDVLWFILPFVVFMCIASFLLGQGLGRDFNKTEINALQAQVDKKYCKGEVIYSGPKERFLGR